MSRDPIGERGGANLYGFVENDGVDQMDVLGLKELGWEHYADAVLQQVNGNQHNFDVIFQNLIKTYFDSDKEDEFCWDCQDDMEEIWEALNELVSGGYGDECNHGDGFEETPGYDDGSVITHFMAAASWSGAGKTLQDIFEGGGADGIIGSTIGIIAGPFSPDLGPGDNMRDTAAAYLGVETADIFDTWSERKCRCIAKKFADGTIKFSDLFGGGNYNQVMRDMKDRDAMEIWVKKRVNVFKKQIEDCE